MDKVELELSEALKRSGELEGGLFVEISLTFCGRDYVARRDFYTVKDGLVYSFVDGVLYATGDSLWNVERDCKRIGKYNPAKKYTPKSSTLSYSEAKKALKL